MNFINLNNHQSIPVSAIPVLDSCPARGNRSLAHIQPIGDQRRSRRVHIQTERGAQVFTVDRCSGLFGPSVCTAGWCLFSFFYFGGFFSASCTGLLRAAKAEKHRSRRSRNHLRDCSNNETKLFVHFAYFVGC